MERFWEKTKRTNEHIRAVMQVERVKEDKSIVIKLVHADDLLAEERGRIYSLQHGRLDDMGAIFATERDVFLSGPKLRQGWTQFVHPDDLFRGWQELYSMAPKASGRDATTESTTPMKTIPMKGPSATIATTPHKKGKLETVLMTTTDKKTVDENDVDLSTDRMDIDEEASPGADGTEVASDVPAQAKSEPVSAAKTTKPLAPLGKKQGNLLNFFKPK